jgi:hypothetical protein
MPGSRDSGSVVYGKFLYYTPAEDQPENADGRCD